MITSLGKRNRQKVRLEISSTTNKYKRMVSGFCLFSYYTYLKARNKTENIIYNSIL